MDKNENVEINHSNKISRKKLIISIIISVIAFILIVVLYKVISYNIGPAKLYNQQVSLYLQEKYNEDFNIKFVQKRNASTYKEVSCDASTGYFWNGIDENINEYIYSFSSKNDTNKKCYVAYAHNIEEDSYKIYEISSRNRGLCGDDPSKTDKSYYKSTQSQMLEIKDSLERYFGKEYTIIALPNINAIDIKTDKSLENVVLNEFDEFRTLFNGVVKLLKYKDICVCVQYSDEFIYITKDSKIENEYTINQILKAK